ncbi:MAG: nitroreductase family protein [Bacilli bacterium]|nr:nitroreductase family protein [Bacilli bacterium]
MSFILKRCSIREFKDIAIEPEKITALLQAAMQAPSAKNQQPWEFIVIDDKSILLELSKTSAGSWPLKTATCAIIPMIMPSELSPHFRVQDLSAATENILLEATNQGLGSVWIGIYPLEDRLSHVENTLRICGDAHPFSIIALGYPLKEKAVLTRFDAKRVHYNKWGE